MRVLLVSNLFPPDVLGGYELLAHDVALALRARGHDVHVLTTGAQRRADPTWVHRELALVRPFGEPASLDRLRHVLLARAQQAATRRALGRAGPFDAALVMSLRRLGMHVPRALAEHGVRAVYCFNDDWLLAHRPGDGGSKATRAVWRAVERGPLAARTWRGVAIERAVYVSDAIRRALIEGGAPVPAGVVAWQGVDRAVFAPRPFRAVPAAPRLLFAGRVHPTKGCGLALEALAALRARGVAATLTIAGTGHPDELARLRALAETRRVSDAVRWPGFVPRAALADVYRAHDVFLFPSIWEEPAGLTYLEAMSTGVPVVALARGGAREVLASERNCLVAEGAPGMAAAILRLTADPGLTAGIVGGGLETVEERASLARYVDAIEGELRGAAGQAVSARDQARPRVSI